jgi:catechol 2,3-dioxygenase-like lactoylglutathione lyase family enzyme
VDPHISLLTLAVDDLDRAVRFYRDGLGLATPGIVGRELERGAVAFFALHGGLKLAVWPRASMGAETGLGPSRPGPPSFTIGHNVESRAEVDRVMEQARRAGATIVRPAGPVFWGGYAGYFADPDGHVWEVATTAPTD